MAFAFDLDGAPRELTILARRPDLVVAVDGRPYRVDELGPPGSGQIRLTIAGEIYDAARLVEGAEIVLRAEGRSHRVLWRDGVEEAGSGSSLSHLRAPMPGAVIEIHAKPGQTLAAGDPVLTIESMKLQTVLGAPRAGVLAELAVTEGALFGKDDVLARLEEEGAKDA